MGNDKTTRVILFDLGGVLMELTGVPIFLQWIGGRITTDEVWRMWLSSPTVRAFESGQITEDVFAEELIKEFGLPINSENLLRSFRSWPQPLPGAADLVARILPRYIRSTLSNTNVLHWSRFTEESGIAPHFHHHFPSHLTGKLKPDEEVFEHVVHSLECQPQEILFLDDQPLNVHAARRCGIEAIVINGVEEAERLLHTAGALASSNRKANA